MSFQLPLLGQFILMIREHLNIGEISQYEFERMFLIPQASTSLAYLMTSLLWWSSPSSSLWAPLFLLNVDKTFWLFLPLVVHGNVPPSRHVVIRCLISSGSRSLEIELLVGILFITGRSVILPRYQYLPPLFLKSILWDFCLSLRHCIFCFAGFWIAGCWTQILGNSWPD